MKLFNELRGKLAEGKKPVSQMTPAEKKADAERRKEYNAYQKSKRNEGAEKYTVKKGNMTRKVDGATADKMKRQGWKLIATEGLDEGAMSDFHLMVQEKVPAEKIAKELGLDLKTVKKLMKDMKESVDLEEGKLPPHLAKFFDKKGDLKPEVLDRLKKSKKGHEFLMGKDVAPKGYGVKEEVELDEAMRGGNAKTFKTLEDWLMAVLSIKGASVTKMGDSLRANGLGRTQSATFEIKKGRGSLLEDLDYVKDIKSTFDEARKDASADLYFDTYSAAVQHAKSQAEKKGFEVVEDDWFNQVTTGKGKPGRGKTTRHTLKLTKNDKPVRQGLSIQVYNRDSAKKPYELNFYVS